MSHSNQVKFCDAVKYMFPQYFESNKLAIDIGSLDVNGNNRGLFEGHYVGIDVADGKNVDIVCTAHEVTDIIDGTADVVLSTNALEHDMHYPKTLAKMVALLKPNGLMFFSVANSWEEHGTESHDAHESGTSQQDSEWKNYYKNLDEKDVREAIDLDKEFLVYQMGVNQHDLQFYGIKKA